MKSMVVFVTLFAASICDNLSRSKRLSRVDDAVVTWSIMNRQVNELMSKKKELMAKHEEDKISISDRLARDIEENSAAEGFPWFQVPVFVHRMFQSGDANNDNSLTWEEFKSMYREYLREGEHHVTRAVYVEQFVNRGYGDRQLAEILFEKGDLNHNGRLDVHDLKLMRQHFDTNRDHQISALEFSNLWKLIINTSINQESGDEDENVAALE